VFVAASILYYRANSPPSDAATYHVVGKQWMWEIRHPDGRREINELHIPIGEPIKLVLSSEDVIHSFYVPAFRAKQDAVPGRYTSMWFTPTRAGEYFLFCAEFCGTQHSRMTGVIHVMKPQAYAQWQRRHPKPPTAQPLQQTGELAFRTLGCNQCHLPTTNAIAPYLEGLYGRTVTLRDGTAIIADEQYIRESILDPAAKVVRGYQPIMPTYAGMLSERQIAEVVAAVRGLADSKPTESRSDGAPIDE
jgi:cytochrome c oxidase subunit 2